MTLESSSTLTSVGGSDASIALHHRESIDAEASMWSAFCVNSRS